MNKILWKVAIGSFIGGFLSSVIVNLIFIGF